MSENSLFKLNVVRMITIYVQNIVCTYCVLLTKNLNYSLGLQLWINMKPYSNQLFSPEATPTTIGITNEQTVIDQKTSVFVIKPGHHVSINVMPKILETTPEFVALTQESR